MNRVLEPEVMDVPAQALAYTRADFGDVNQGFVDELLRRYPALARGRVVDLGAGPADIPRRLAERAPAATILAVDASLAMLSLAAPAERGRSRRGRVLLCCARLPDVPVGSGMFDGVLANSLLHHLPDPEPFWREIRRLGAAGAVLHVMDLARPPSVAAARAIVEAAAPREPAILKTDFFNSLLAAFTPAEVTEQLAGAGLAHLGCRMVSERHWLVSGEIAPRRPAAG